ncbi:hypothetical protein [Kordiimonas marina]|nr:hypothetical protein [Kordiimonas marina]MCJ9430538.1 hypothetical protein [Kordiimonas marina]
MSKVQRALHHISSTQIDMAEKHFLPPEIFDYFSAVLELSHSPAHS